MIRAFEEKDLSAVMQIWLDTNMKAHHFIPKEYWTDNYSMVEEQLPRAEIYVFENGENREIQGFIGLTDDYIAGIFVRESEQSKGIGKQLLDYVKAVKPAMSLRVYQRNLRAIAFYKREQFVIRTEGMDETTMEKEFLMTWNKN